MFLDTLQWLVSVAFIHRGTSIAAYAGKLGASLESFKDHSLGNLTFSKDELLHPQLKCIYTGNKGKRRKRQCEYRAKEKKNTIEILKLNLQIFDSTSLR